MKQLVLFFVFIMFSCKNNSDSHLANLNSNQTFIKNSYNKITYYSNESPDSIAILIPILEKKVALENNEFKAMVCQFKATNYFSKSQFELAFKQQQITLSLLNNSTADSLIARAIQGKATYYKRTGDYPKAIDNYFRALKMYEKLNKTESIGSILCNIGEVYSMKNDPKNTEKYLKKGLNYLAKNKKTYNYLIHSHNLANFYGMNGDFQSALKIDEEGILVSDSLKSERMKTKFLNNKANCFMYSGNLDSAKIYFDSSLVIDLKYQEKMHIADTYANFAQLAIFKNNFPEAETQIKKAIEIQNNANLKPDLGNSYQILKDIYLKQNRTQEALDHSRNKFQKL